MTDTERMEALRDRLLFNKSADPFDTTFRGQHVQDVEFLLSQLDAAQADLKTLTDSVSRVYDNATGGHISNPFTDPTAVIQAIERFYNEVREEYATESVVAAQAEIQRLREAFTLLLECRGETYSETLAYMREIARSALHPHTEEAQG